MTNVAEAVRKLREWVLGGLYMSGVSDVARDLDEGALTTLGIDVSGSYGEVFCQLRTYERGRRVGRFVDWTASRLREGNLLRFYFVGDGERFSMSTEVAISEADDPDL